VVGDSCVARECPRARQWSGAWVSYRWEVRGELWDVTDRGETHSLWNHEQHHIWGTRHWAVECRVRSMWGGHAAVSLGWTSCNPISSLTNCVHCLKHPMRVRASWYGTNQAHCTQRGQ
jgi:hypothetical protein